MGVAKLGSLPITSKLRRMIAMSKSRQKLVANVAYVERRADIPDQPGHIEWAQNRERSRMIGALIGWQMFSRCTD